MNRIWKWVVAASCIGAAGAWAEHVPGHLAAAVATQQAPAALSEGEVRKVDKEAGKVTLRHGPLENLGMPGMTMVFRVKDPAWLDTFKKGDRIRFRAEKVEGVFTVTEVAK